MQKTSRRNLLIGGLAIVAMGPANAQSVFAPFNDIRNQPGVDPNGASDSTAGFNAALANGSTVIPPGDYRLSGDIIIPSNRTLLFQSGALVTNVGGRFTGYNPGGGNIKIENGGDLNFVATQTRPQLGDWWNIGGVAQRGLIELGGSISNPAKNLTVTGRGIIRSDWTGAVPTGLYNFADQVNKKGVAIVAARRALVKGQEVYGIRGEAIYYNASGDGAQFDVTFCDNYVHDCAFNALNFNISNIYTGLTIARNTVRRCMTGIESSAGATIDNSIDGCNSGIIFGGGGGIMGQVIRNKIVSTIGNAFDLQFGQPVEQFDIMDNMAVSTGGTAFLVGSLYTSRFLRNRSYYHAYATPGWAFNILSNCYRMQVDGNVTYSPGPKSAGNFTCAAQNSIVGSNPVF